MRPGLFADAVDALLGDDNRAIGLVVALLGAHVALAVAAVVQRRIPRLMIGLNLAVAAVILVYKASQYWAYPALIEEARDDLTGNSDVRLVLFEAVVAVAAGLALAGRRLAAALSVAAFLVHAFVAAAFIAFAMTFHLDRLI